MDKARKLIATIHETRDTYRETIRVVSNIANKLRDRNPFAPPPEDIVDIAISMAEIYVTSIRAADRVAAHYADVLKYETGMDHATGPSA